MATQRALVVGGSGFLGRSICQTCVARGWSVVSLSRSGEPSFPDRTRPAWAEKVEWVQGSAFDDTVLKSIMSSITAVVHTLGILLETDYKSGGISTLVAGIANGLRENHMSSKRQSNPLATTGSNSNSNPGAYEKVNRDSAEAVLRAFLDSKPNYLSTDEAMPEGSPFLYISAEDVFRPFIPERYILTKREAENKILQLSEIARSTMQESLGDDNDSEQLDRPGRLVRPVILRPSFIYHPQLRRPSAIPAVLLNLSASIQRNLPAPLQANTAASIFSALTVNHQTRIQQDLPSSAESLANLLSLPPIHVDTVAEAVCRSIEDKAIGGVVGVRDMQTMTAARRNTDAFKPSSATL